jgi:hypothetical protein
LFNNFYGASGREHAAWCRAASAKSWRLRVEEPPRLASAVGLTPEDFPDYNAYLAAMFAPKKPRVIEEHHGVTSVISAIEAGTGEGLSVSFGTFSVLFDFPST